MTRDHRFTLKMESVSKHTIFGLKLMVKSGLEIIFSDKNYIPTHGGISKIFFIDRFSHIIFRTKILILGTDSILREKTVVE